MQVNESKLQCIVFGKSDNLSTFNVRSYNIVPDDNVKILGLNVNIIINQLGDSKS
jgi:hypothetical protein